jgi:hypothetical protein
LSGIALEKAYSTPPESSRWAASSNPSHCGE